MTTFTNVALSNTFNEFRQAHNDVANTLTDITNGDGITVVLPTTSLAGNIVNANTLSATYSNTTNSKISSLTSGRVVLAGTDGLLQDDSGLTFNTSTNTLTAGNSSVSGALSVTGTTTLLGITTFGTGANNAVYYPANGSLYLSSDVESTTSGRLNAPHVHASWHVGVGGNVEAWSAGKGTDPEQHHVFAIGDADAPIDMLVVNESNGANAYAEFIAINDSGSIENGWVSMGLNSSDYSEGAFGITKADDAYILYQAPTGTTASGDLVIGTGSNGTGNKIIFSANGFDDPSNNQQIIITPGVSVLIDINTQSSNTTTGALVVNGGIGLQGNLNVGGNVAITGTITLGGGGNTVSTSSLAVDNPIIFVGSNNAADTFDLGFVGEYTATGTKYNGLVRDASDSGKWKLFSGIANEPANTVNFTGATYDTLYLGGIQAVSTTASTSTTSGAVIVSGGVGVAGNIFGGGTVNDSLGNVREVPQNATTGSYTLVATDSGKHVTATGNVTVPQNIFTVGQTITIYNNSSSSISVLQGSGTTLRQAGTASTGTRTLAQRGVCTLLCIASNDFVINGGGLT